MIYAENILICIAIPLLLSLLFIDGISRRFVGSFVIGMVVCLLSAYISGYVNLLSGMGDEDTAIFISPVVEEIMKLLPLLFAILMFMPENKVMYQLAMGIGAGFATFENCCYILTAGAESLPYVIIRGFAMGGMHIVSILALTLGIELMRRFKSLSFPAILGALSLSMTFHGLYNLLVSEPGISSYIGYAMPLITAALLYVPYKRFRRTQ